MKKLGFYSIAMLSIFILGGVAGYVIEKWPDWWEKIAGNSYRSDYYSGGYSGYKYDDDDDDDD